MIRAPMVRLYRHMVRMRFFEEALADLWAAGLISGELHLGVGEEGIVAGLVDHLGEGDALALDHRPTTALVGRGVDLTEMALEMVGSESGLCHGRGGHMHLFAPELLAASSGIVGAAAPLACGFALAGQRMRHGSVAVAFVGEGAINQGMTMEAFNLAVVWRLPVVFVIKDNGWAITTRSSAMTAGSVQKRVRGFGMPVVRVDGSDVAAVWRVAGRAIDSARRGSPFVVHATCHRPRGHFEGDPLVRMVEHPMGERDQLYDLLRGAKDGASPASRRLAGLARVTQTVGSMALHRLGRHRDPVRRAARALTDEEAGSIRAAARHEVDRSVDAARRAVDAG